MYQHMILMCSDYSKEQRIAFHKCYSKISDIFKFEQMADEIRSQFKNVEFSFHHIPTDSRIEKSIVEYDSYFDDVVFCSDLEDFKENIKISMRLTPEDIAKYILCMDEFDQLQVQKLLYFVYEEFSRTHDRPLFDKIFEAWKYGPVIPSIYSRLSKYKSNKIELSDKDLERIKLQLKFERVEDADAIIKTIYKIVYKHGGKTGGELIDETHCKGTPWSVTVDESGLKSYIPFDLIKEHARAER